jgi:rubredoxin
MPTSELSSRAQAKKLGCDEGDWNLPGGNAVRTRTRFAGRVRPSIAARNATQYCVASSSSSDESFDADDEDSEDELLEDDDRPTKPAASRVIVEVKSTIEAIEKHSVCPDCNGPMEASMETLCVATSLAVACKSNICGYVYNADLPAVAGKCFDGESDKRKRSNDFAVNVFL